MTPLSQHEMSPYEKMRWDELNDYWQRKSQRKIKNVLPVPVRQKISDAATSVRSGAKKVAETAERHTPHLVKDAAGKIVDSSLEPAVFAVGRLIDLVNEWVVELSDPKAVLAHHQAQGRDVESLKDLTRLDLEELEHFTRGLTLRWRTFGAGEGAALGSLAMIPVPGLGSAAAIGLDLLATHLLSIAIATRVCYSLGFDVENEQNQEMVMRIVRGAYGPQATKAVGEHKAASAFGATAGRVKWSEKIREDHHVLAGIEKLMKTVSGGRVPITQARMGLPLVSVVLGAGTNAYLLGDVAKQARQYAATVHLSEKYGLALPASFAVATEGDPGDADTPEGVGA